MENKQISLSSFPKALAEYSEQAQLLNRWTELFTKIIDKKYWQDFGKICQRYKPGAAKFKKLIELFRDIELRDGINPLDHTSIQEILLQKDSGIDALIGRLWDIRFPELSAMRKKILHYNSRLVSHGICASLVSDVSFNEDHIYVNFKIGSIQDLEYIKEFVDHVKKDGEEFEKILKLFRINKNV